LHLVARRRMELWEINIHELIDQYLAFVGEIGPDELDPTSEFIEMAARLVYLKSASLLPRRDEADDLERELTGQLIEYHLCKKMAARLRDMSEGINFFVREPLEIEFSTEYSTIHDPSSLLAAYMSIMGKGARRALPSTGEFDELVTAPVVSVQTRIIFIMRLMRRGNAKYVSDFFSNSRSRSESVATFLGLLELMRAGRIEIGNDGGVISKNHHRRTDEH
ncbi:MAG: ScpA family protein, partial [Oscillospiraceae bacterium]